MCLKAIMDSHEANGRNPGGNPNFDPANNLFACDLLYLLCEKILYDGCEEHIKLLLTQLDEMATGLCPQGRTTRLFQILIMLKKDLTPTSA